MAPRSLKAKLTSGSILLDQLLANDILHPGPPPKDAMPPPCIQKERRRKIVPLTKEIDSLVATQGSTKRIMLPFSALPEHLRKILPTKALPGASITTVPNILEKRSNSKLGEEVYYAVQFKITIGDDATGVVEKVYHEMTHARTKMAQRLAAQGLSHRDIFSVIREMSKERDLDKGSTSTVVVRAQAGSGVRRKITFKLPGTFTDADVAGVARQIAMRKIQDLGATPQRNQVHDCIANVHNEIVVAARARANGQRPFKATGCST